MGTPVEGTKSSSRFWMLKNMAREKNHDVTKPIATVPMIAVGIAFSGWATSSAMCVAQSRQAKAQLVFISPTMKALPLKWFVSPALSGFRQAFKEAYRSHSASIPLR